MKGRAAKVADPDLQAETWLHSHSRHDIEAAEHKEQHLGIFTLGSVSSNLRKPIDHEERY